MDITKIIVVKIVFILFVVVEENGTIISVRKWV